MNLKQMQGQIDEMKFQCLVQLIFEKWVIKNDDYQREVELMCLKNILVMFC